MNPFCLAEKILYVTSFLIQEIHERSQGRWRPSSGAIYPALQQLEDEGLISAEEQDGKKVFALTAAGSAYLEAQNSTEVPWENVGEEAPAAWQEMQQLSAQVLEAAMTLASAGNPQQQQRAQKLLKQTRRALYQILSEDEEENEAADNG